MELSKRDEGIKNFITTGLDTYFGIKHNLPPVITMLSQVSDVSLLVFEAQQNFRESKFYKFFKKVVPTEDQKNELYEKLGEDKEDFLRSLLLKLESIDDERKAELVGTMYNTLFKNPNAVDLFRRCIIVVERTYYNDLKVFIDAPNLASKLKEVIEGDSENLLGTSLQTAGLVKIETTGFDGGTSRYSITALGDNFKMFCADY